MEQDVKFDMNEIEKSFKEYKNGQFVDALVVKKRDNGVVVNIGGKNDAFVEAGEFDYYDDVKIGDTFKGLISGKRTEDNMILVLKRKAEDFMLGTQLISSIKIGSTITCDIKTASKFGISAQIGDYSIFIPISQISGSFVKDPAKYIGSTLVCVVMEIDTQRKKIIASSKVVEVQKLENAKSLFFSSCKVGDRVVGTVKRLVNSGAIITVSGYDCYVNISDLSYTRNNHVSDILKPDDEKEFIILSMDNETGRVALGYKQLQEDPRKIAIKTLEIDKKYTGEVVKILKFGAILRLQNGAEGLLHASNLTDDVKKAVHELVHLGDKLEVYVKDVDIENNRVEFTVFEPSAD